MDRRVTGLWRFLCCWLSTNHERRPTAAELPVRPLLGAVIACWLECQTCDQKVASLNPGRSGRGIFFSRVNFVCWLLFGVCSTPSLLHWHLKDPGHSAKSAGGRLHLNTHTPFTQQNRSGLTMLLSRHSVGTYQETGLQVTHLETLNHSPLCLLSHCGLILA